MLVRLRINNFVLARDVTLELAPGLNLITGETGAGKSLIVGALALIAGARAEQGMVRQGTDRARVEALFDLRGRPDLSALVTRHGYDIEDSELLVRRELTPDGRSKAFVGSGTATVAALRTLSAELIELHGQHEPQVLLQPDYHRELLDRSCGSSEARVAVRRSANRLKEFATKIAELQAHALAREGRLELLRFRLTEFGEVAPQPGEEQALREERDRLRHAEDIGEALRSALELIYEGEGAALDRIHAASRKLLAQGQRSPAYEDLGERLDELRIEIGDIATELRTESDDLVPNPTRLGEIEDRLHALERLRRRFEDAPLEDIIADAAEMQREADELASQGSSEEALRQDAARELKQYIESAEQLSAARAAAASRLQEQVAGSLADLAMPKARLEVALSPHGLEEIGPDDARPEGLEDIEFLLQANPGEPARPLRKVASGGELSRLMLALDMALEGGLPRRTLLFDEVDQGLGGEAAERLGVFLSRLARHHQVICITHLPQVAARAEQHITVSKKVRSGRTVAVVKTLDERLDRVAELARMLGGQRASDGAYRHAEEMIRRSQKNAGASP